MRQFKASLAAFTVIVLLLVSQLLVVSSAHAASTHAKQVLTKVGTSRQSLSNLPSPSWWNGNCDVNNFPGSYQLSSANYRGLVACGPLNTQHTVHFYPGAWGIFEWQCVELSMRYLYLAYGIAPYPAYGNQVVQNYRGSQLQKIANNTPGQAPQAGDVLSYGSTTPGHTSVVMSSSVDGNGNGSITVLEENASSSGTNTIAVNNWYVHQTYRMNITGWLHSPSTPPPPPTMVKTASAVPSPLHHPADFSLHAGTQVAEYNSTTHSFSFQGTWVQPVGAIDWAAAGDFNGDGVADFAIHANNTIYVYLSTKTSFVFQGSWVSPVGAFDWGGVGDFNGDGKADLAIHANNAIYVYLSTGTSFQFQGPWVAPVGSFDWGGVGDFNGDGKADFAIHANNAIYTYLSTGYSFVFQGPWVAPVGAFDWGGVGDFNGDGKADFAIHANNAIYVYLSTGNSFAFQGPWVSPVGSFDWGGVGDVNGDGVADLAIHANNTIYVYLSTGNSFQFQGSWVSPVGAFDSGWLADFNGN